MPPEQTLLAGLPILSSLLIILILVLILVIICDIKFFLYRFSLNNCNKFHSKIPPPPLFPTTAFMYTRTQKTGDIAASRYAYQAHETQHTTRATAPRASTSVWRRVKRVSGVVLHEPFTTHCPAEIQLFRAHNRTALPSNTFFFIGPHFILPPIT